MIDADEIKLAVELQRKSYGLLQWIGEAVRKGELLLSRAHEYGTESEAFREWLVTYWRQIPGRLRPRMSDAGEVDRYVNLFVSYLSTSIELVEEPGLQLAPQWGAAEWRCKCPLCSRLVRASHVQARKLRDEDRRRADEEKLGYLARLAALHRRRLSDDAARELVDSDETSELVALATYGESLVGRSRGQAGEPALLALWREFAWTSTGAPKRGFELTAASILESEAELAKRLAALPSIPAQPASKVSR